ncbi:ABC transporter substrate-binding protein [Falsiroseomonas sp. HW251]|uniref:ABC transporter substrate-binding protein n=1 Tax=Falsiroseomonas sp. HW251 TaxID=3390998 RepID=UPI003D31262A
MSTISIPRRTLMAGAAAATLLPARPRAQNRPYRIGVLSDFSGPFRDDSGPTSLAAVRQAVEDFGPAARGMTVEVIMADHQNRPDTGSAIARRWFDVDGVDAVVDLVGSAVALAVAGVAREKDKVCIVSGAGTVDLTGAQCSPNTVHWAYDTWMLAKSNGGTTVRTGGDTWFFITADYAFGQALQRDTTPFIEAAGGRVIGTARHPFPGTTDFSSYIVQAVSSRAKVLGIANAGSDLSNTLRQAAEFGVTRRGMRVVGLVMVLTNIKALGLDATAGLQFTETFYWDLNERTRAVSNRIAPKIGGNRMNMLQAGCYGGTAHLLKALADMPPAERSSGRAVVQRMKAMPTDDDAFGPGRIREDGRKLHPAYLLQVKTPQESTGGWDFCKLVATTPADEAFRPMSEGGCAFVRG